MQTKQEPAQPSKQALSDTASHAQTPTVPPENDTTHATQRARHAPHILSSLDVSSLQHTVGNRSVARLLQRNSVTPRPLSSYPYVRTSSPKAIQRYQAGESGHGRIEREGLLKAGFTADEAAEAYIGNWMRDLSQLGVFPLVELLGMGEFGRPIDQSKLGTYIPSEHMDNPEGGNTVEDLSVYP